MATIYRSRLPAVPARGHEAVPQGRALLHGQVRDREAQRAARPARPAAQGEDGRLRRAAAREAEGQAHLRRAREPVPPLLRGGRPARSGITGETLLQLLERRLDNVVYRLGFATSRAQARQLVRHGHFTVNGKKVDIPSYSVRSGDTVARPRRQRARTRPSQHAMEEVKGRGIPEWLSLDAGADRGRIVVSCRRASRSTCPCRNS